MTIKTGQLVYRVRAPDGRWVRKTGNIMKVAWVDDESQATFWRKLHHLKSSLKDGIFADKDNLDGLPLAAFHVYEYVVTIERTKRKRRLSELDRFYEKEGEDGE